MPNDNNDDFDRYYTDIIYLVIMFNYSGDFIVLIALYII